ncbi:MAG: 2,3-bisphosphoglycerate-independent phosphoglycerate mutase [Chloroflexi bacterium]|nr:2,3-bisphosphoglycerate-independent phosphoglycerate mutase [Chloroflexota bacterium]
MSPPADVPSAPRPLVLVIRDGWGVADDDAETARRNGNAVALGRVPVLRQVLARYPHGLLQASGEAVGLPQGQIGSSEVGHQNLGAGRVVYQDIMRITVAIRDGSFFQNPVLLKAMGEVRRNGTRLHLMGLLSDGGVHSHHTHLYALLELARRQRLGREQVAVHAIMDGRDTPPKSGAGYLEALEAEMARIGIGSVGTVVGRYYSMDRDNRWERTARAYQAYVLGTGRKAVSSSAAIHASYEAGRADEFVDPTAVVGSDGRPLGLVRDGDAIVFFNYRPDRARQIARSFTGTTPAEAPPEASKPRVRVHFVCLTEYDATIPAPVAFPPDRLANPLGQVIAEAGLTQLRIAETEKYAHVTYFFNGGREAPFVGEDRALIPSPRVATYDLRPEMSAVQITDELLQRLGTDPASQPYDLVVLNFANADMVGHTGMLEPTLAALEVVDTCIGRIVERVRQLGGAVLITADHGNCERMIADDGTPFTAHTTNPVHLILVDDTRVGSVSVRNGLFADVGPTILSLLNLPVPAEMTGTSLLQSD